MYVLVWETLSKLALPLSTDCRHNGLAQYVLCVNGLMRGLLKNRNNLNHSALKYQRSPCQSLLDPNVTDDYIPDPPTSSCVHKTQQCVYF